MAKLSVCCLLMFLGVGIYARPHELARSRSRRGVADPDVSINIYYGFRELLFDIGCINVNALLTA